MNEWEWQLLEAKHPVECLEIAGISVRVGDRVRLRPRKGGDVMDLALAGQDATIESIEQDYDGKSHVCVVLDDDPGRDLGFLRQPGHRFFFSPEEVEPLAPGEAQPKPAGARPVLLIAGIGNIFLGDDGFGVEVARRLCSIQLPQGVRVADFGIRGFDLSYALQDGYETTILIDAYPRGGEPGTVYVVEPDLKDLTSVESQGAAAIETHGMDPIKVLRLAASMGGPLKRVLLVGCEPATLGGEDGHVGLSEQVEKAVDEAVKQIELLVTKIMNGDWPGIQQQERKEK